MKLKTTWITSLLARLSTFGPAPVNGAVIPSGAVAISEKDDDTEADMKPTTQQDEDDQADGADGTVEGNASGDASGSGDAGDGTETSTEPSPEGDTTEGAQEADDGVAHSYAQAVRAAVDGLMASPDTDAPREMSVAFEPTITDEMMKEYEAAVEAGNGKKALAKLMGSVVSEALGFYDKKRVLPVEITVDATRRDKVNDARIAEWGTKNPVDAQNTALWAKMTEVYRAYADKHGRYKADRISMEQLAIMAKGELSPAERKGAKAKKPAESEPEAQKRQALGATKTPGTIGNVRPKAAGAPKPKVGHDGDAYRNHLKNESRDIF